MSLNTNTTHPKLQVSEMAENLVGSEIIKLAGEIKALIAKGEKIHNFTIGDFNPQIFPIPAELNSGIQDMYAKGQTNYPASNGMEELRETVSDYLKERAQLTYSTNEILVSGGARPLIYAVYQTLVDPGDEVVFPVPSWNNNHYTHLTRGKSTFIQTTPDSNFMPTAEDLRGKLENARLLALCSPLNPTGTVFSKEQLLGICEMVIEINQHRERKGEKPLYLLYDQIYWQLTFGETQHYDPVNLMSEMRPYTIF
ncbi:MAG: pyridoxal phosphate-dependent aminotransferase, partial [Flavobacteriales bacterium]